MKRIFLSAAIIAVAGSAMGNPTMQFLSVAIGRNVQVSFDGGSHFQSTFAGDLNMRLRTSSSIYKDFLGFCLSPTVSMGSSQTNTTITNTGIYGSPKGGRVGKLIQTYAPTIFAGGSTNANKDLAMALQVSLWEILAETSSTNSVTGGIFRARASDGHSFTSSQQSLISTMLGSGGSDTALVYQAALDRHGHPVSQDIGTVPEPTAMATLALGALGLIRRRHRSQSGR